MSKEPPPVVAEINVRLIGEAAIALDNAVALCGVSRTDTVNRAVQAYAFFQALLSNGGEIYVKESPDSDMHRLLFEQPQ
jgi:hypothetical protein